MKPTAARDSSFVRRASTKEEHFLQLGVLFGRGHGLQATF